MRQVLRFGWPCVLNLDEVSSPLRVKELAETLDAPNRFLETIVRDLNPQWPRFPRPLKKLLIHFFNKQARRESTHVFLALSPSHPERLPAMLKIIPR